MGVRHLNYTGRKRIARRDVRIALEGVPPTAAIAAAWDLGSYGFPNTAQIVVEAQAGWTVQRFDFGTIEGRTEPISAILNEFETADGLLFRLKVIGTGQLEGQILGEADRLHPSGTAEDLAQRSFVVVRPEELGAVVWRVSFDENQPLLLVNNRIPDIHSFLRRQDIAALVLPEVLRQVLTEAVERSADDDDPFGWTGQALRLATGLVHSAAPQSEDAEEIDQWVDAVVQRFAARHRLFDGVRLGTEMEEE